MKKVRLICFLALCSLMSCAQRQEVRIDGVEIPTPVKGEMLLQRMAYTVSYNPSTLCPNWVAWKLTADHVDGDVKRINVSRGQTP